MLAHDRARDRVPPPDCPIVQMNASDPAVQSMLLQPVLLACMHGFAERSYTRGLDGQIGQRYDWRNDQDRDSGYFTPTREYERDNYTCRDWVATTNREGRRMNRRGSSCRYEDGSWYSQQD